MSLSSRAYSTMGEDGPILCSVAMMCKYSNAEVRMAVEGTATAKRGGVN